MDIRYVQNITYTCSCGTCIKFKVEQDTEKQSELFHAVSNLKCPRCDEDLSFDARSALDAVKEYNRSVEDLLEAQKIYHATLG